MTTRSNRLNQNSLRSKSLNHDSDIDAW